MSEIILFIVLLTSCALAGVISLHGANMSLMDVPNQRSCHDSPIPRGGGIGIVVGFMIFLLHQWSISHEFLAIYFAVGALLIGLIGLWDDLKTIPIAWRLVVHILAAILLLWALKPCSAPAFKGFSHILGGILLLIILFAQVWLLNLYNFMDGIDGLAGIETVSVCIAAAVLIGPGATPFAIGSLLALAVASIGFLLWNWPPARVFMGDSGSCFIGYVLGGLVIKTALMEETLPLSSWFILLGVFVADATYTLAHRMIKREAWTKSHRSHAYQRAARHFGRHWPVTVAILLINVFWLFPLAWLVCRYPSYRIYGVIIAYLPLIIVVYIFKSGKITRHLAP